MRLAIVVLLSVIAVGVVVIAGALVWPMVTESPEEQSIRINSTIEAERQCVDRLPAGQMSGEFEDCVESTTEELIALYYE